MKFLVIGLCTLVVAALAQHMHHAGQDPHGSHAVHEKCQANPETHVDEKIIAQIQKHHDKSSITAEVKKHLLCMSQGLNLVDQEGKVNVEGVKTHVGHVEQDAAKAEEIVKECAVNKASVDETVGYVWGCLHQKHILGGHHGSNEGSSEESGEHHHEHHH